MSEHYDFHYQPTGSGAISGQQVLQQTEDAINELGDYVNDNVGGAMDVAQQALETAQNAETNAQTALDTANSFSSAIQSAQQDANTALSTAQTAQATASNANNTAIQAQQDASSAVTTANNASGQVSTLSGTVTALGQRVTTAEGNIGQNTSDITALTTRVGTAEGNITTLQNDVSIAQGNASSAMATAGTVKQQAYVFRYSSTALVASSTNSNTLLDNTDNLKVGDKVIDSDGKIFSIVSVDTANSTVTVGSALVDLAQDSDVVHKSGNETITGTKTFENGDIQLKSTSAEYSVSGGYKSVSFYDKNLLELSRTRLGVYSSGLSYIKQTIIGYDSNNQQVDIAITFSWSSSTKPFLRPDSDNLVSLGTSGHSWANVFATNYYYGSDNVEFSTKFVTTDTAQTIHGAKTFKNHTYIYDSNATATTPNLYLRSSKIEISSQGNTSGSQDFTYLDKNKVTYANVKGAIQSNGSAVKIRAITKDSSDNSVVNELQMLAYTNGNKAVFPSYSNEVDLGISSFKWKSFNGVEPSSLSLPSGNASDVIDISSYFANTGTGEENSYTASANGWIYLRLGDISSCQAAVYDANINRMWGQSSTGSVEQLTIPILKGQTLITQWNTSSSVHIAFARFIPCQGNV